MTANGAMLPPKKKKTDRIGMRHGVNHVQGAAEPLLTWTKRGPKWQQAVEAYVAAMADEVSPKDVRKAFEEAPMEEGMFLPSY
ncbi:MULTISPECIES: DUF982 domain-containing protein [unclassified Mesorhizobium]|uniref:DUF982 domain-containing protein n=1 Tax=unclassified Mesorhizobium TaxID=325217 RepID=UPI0033370621